jgi:putative ABC transport system permease protein
VSLSGYVLRQIRARPAGSTLTILNVALGVMLVSAILNLREDLVDHFRRPGSGYSIVCGPHGSPLQLVLNAIYHLDESPGLMPFSAWRELEQNPAVGLAVPYAVGDSFRGFRVVATTEAVFAPSFPHPAGATTADKFAAGRGFTVDRHSLEHALEDLRAQLAGEGTDHAHHHHEDDRAEAVVGAEVAARLGLRVGDRIEPTHGVEGEKAHAHEHLWNVVGILKPSGTPVDRVVFINLDSFYRIPDHAGALIPGTAEVGLSAVLVFPRSKVHKALLLPALRKRQEFSTADVATEIHKLFGYVGSVEGAFLIVAVLVVAIGITSVLVSILNSMNERRREVAILRALGARRAFVTLAAVAEAAGLCFAGAVVGIGLAHLGLWLAGPAVAGVSGFVPVAARLLPAEFLVVAATAGAGALAGLVPAILSYRTDVASHLAPTT